jgi:hypothetical protein
MSPNGKNFSGRGCLTFQVDRIADGVYRKKCLSAWMELIPAKP